MQSKKRIYAFGTEEEQGIKEALAKMVSDSSYNTPAGYTANSAVYPDGLIPFVDKHMQYLNINPKLDAGMYLANLRLKSRLRT